MSIIDWIVGIWKDAEAILKALNDIKNRLTKIEKAIDGLASDHSFLAAQLGEMRGQLNRIEAALIIEQAVTFTVVVGDPEDQETGEARKGTHMTFDHITILDSERVRVTVDPTSIKDKKGNPAKIDGTPTFESADPAIATFVTDADDATGFTGMLTAVGALTDATALSVTVDADLGAGVTPLVVNGLVEITAGAAKTFGVTVGTPEEQP